MRKIESSMIAAIRAGRPFCQGNTRVGPLGEGLGTGVWLHGNLIAEISGPNGTRWTLAGWNTQTTRSRIRALANAFHWCHRVHTHGGVPYTTDRAASSISTEDWVDAF